jgi:hypothetical protein
MGFFSKLLKLLFSSFSRDGTRPFITHHSTIRHNHVGCFDRSTTLALKSGLRFPFGTNAVKRASESLPRLTFRRDKGVDPPWLSARRADGEHELKSGKANQMERNTRQVSYEPSAMHSGGQLAFG